MHNQDNEQQYTRSRKEHWEQVILGNFNEWVKEKIRPTLQKNEALKKSYDLYHPQ